MVVVLAIRKKRDPISRNICDGKDKHLGIDMTVTTPLDMGAGQQRFVIAYTLKQGVERQPDILNAQKCNYYYFDYLKKIRNKHNMI